MQYSRKVKESSLTGNNHLHFLRQNDVSGHIGSAEEKLGSKRKKHRSDQQETLHEHCSLVHVTSMQSMESFDD